MEELDAYRKLDDAQPILYHSSGHTRAGQNNDGRWSFPPASVVQNGKLEVIITKRALRQHWGYLDSTNVSAATTSGPVTITPSVKVEDAVHLMLKYKIGGLPIVEDGKLVGILSTSDVLRALLEVLGATEGILKE